MSIKTTLTLGAEVKDRFFDRAAVLHRVHRDNVKRLGKIGAFIRQRSRTSLRRRKRISLPGQTPSVHSTDKFASLKNILFAMDRDFESVVIGPVGFMRLKRSSRRTVPELMEFGGTSTTTLTLVGDRWLPGMARGGNRPTKEVIGNYSPRPFMGPALDAEIAAGTIGNLFVSR